MWRWRILSDNFFIATGFQYRRIFCSCPAHGLNLWIPFSGQRCRLWRRNLLRLWVFRWVQGCYSFSFGFISFSKQGYVLLCLSFWGYASNLQVLTRVVLFFVCSFRFRGVDVFRLPFCWHLNFHTYPAINGFYPDIFFHLCFWNPLNFSIFPSGQLIDLPAGFSMMNDQPDCS